MPYKKSAPVPPHNRNSFLPHVFDEELASHHPNCSVVTDDVLAQTVDGVWPSQNHHININYVFSLPAFYWAFAPNPSRYHLKNVPENIVSIFQQTVRAVLGRVVAANNGIVSFKEVKRGFVTDYSPWFRGIFYAQTATVAEFAEDNEGAFTVVRWDNNGRLKQGIIHLPIDLEIYNDTMQEYQPGWIEYAISHETYHGFGGEHLQNYPVILALLQNLPDGVFCSVMDYPNIIGTNISSCTYNCTPAYAIYPGQLDIRSMQQAYLFDNYNHGYDKAPYYIFNAMIFLMFYLFITNSYMVAEGLAGFALRGVKKPYLQDTVVPAILNITMLAFLSALEAPIEILVLLGISMGIKMIPHTVLERATICRQSPTLKFLFSTPFPLYVTALTSIFSDGVLPLPLLLSFIFNVTGVFVGTVSGILMVKGVELLLPSMEIEEVQPDVAALTGVAAPVEIEMLGNNDAQNIGQRAEEKQIEENQANIVAVDINADNAATIVAATARNARPNRHVFFRANSFTEGITRRTESPVYALVRSLSLV